ncbi:MAG: arsenate reductase family protein [Pseudomonadota bacterium]
MIRGAGIEPVVIEYLEAGWTRPQLLGLFAAADVTPRQALREKRSPAEELGLLEDGSSDDAIIDAMLEHPVLVNRPFVCTSKGVALCRPSDTVLELLDTWPEGPFETEQGVLIIDADGNRVSS